MNSEEHWDLGKNISDILECIYENLSFLTKSIVWISREEKHFSYLQCEAREDLISSQVYLQETGPKIWWLAILVNLQEKTGILGKLFLWDWALIYHPTQSHRRSKLFCQFVLFHMSISLKKAVQWLPIYFLVIKISEERTGNLFK